jgi:bifunctional UDP-N-acetylglucosamine pyrophosphorylase / glucosamine-1-phosphate N-acetyltransferase
MAKTFNVVIMAAGKGTRMRSAVPKVLHPLCGKPMVEWVIDAAREAGAGKIVAVTRPGDGVAEGLPDDVAVAEQREGEGTGSAVLAARGVLRAGEPVLILSGDHPLVSAELIGQLAHTHRKDGAAATLLTTEELDPTGYGRIVRGADGSVERIVETKQTEGLPAEELAIREINIGAYAFDPDELLRALDEVEVGPTGERYLTEVFPALRARERKIASHKTLDARSALGVNSRVELMEAERLARRDLIAHHALAGVTFEAPDTVVLDASVELGEDVIVAQGVTLKGVTRIAPGAQIGPHSMLVDAVVGERATIVHSHLLECEVERETLIGPFAYLRPGTVIREGAKVGTFVEVKNSDVGPGAKVPHLSYIGDADVGEGANLGASTITANYDGQRKHRTVVGKRVKSGIHTSLVAPVNVGDEAYTGAGSVITGDVPEGALGISRPQQRNVEGYAERVQEGTDEE